MKQTARIISIHAADTSGVCSMLYELGGMVVVHDASGCNSTYSTHDEPRWYDHESMVYISGISEMEAIMGDDEKLISDIVRDATELKPRFIAIAGTPIPAMTGFDFAAAAQVIEARTGIPSFGFATTGMGTYIEGAGMALEAVVRRFTKRGIEKTARPSVNILGLTPLDFSINGEDKSVAAWLKKNGFSIGASLAMDCTLEDIECIGAAHVNLVVSACGLPAARALYELFGTPYVIGLPVAGEYAALLSQRLKSAAQKGESFPHQGFIFDCPRKGAAVIGEGVRSLSLAEALTLQGVPAYAVCASEFKADHLRPCDVVAPDEDEIIEVIAPADTVIADPLYKPIVPAEKRFITRPHEAFSGRIFRKDIPDIVKDGFDIDR